LFVKEPKVPSPHPQRGLVLGAVEFCASMAGTFMSLAIFFYTTGQLGWSLRANALQAMAQSVVYIGGALAAHGLQARRGRVRALILLYVLLAAATALPLLAPGSSALVSLAGMLYALGAGAAWPQLESLVSGSASGRQLSARLGTYNVVWSIASLATMALLGLLLERGAGLVWLLAAGIHVGCMLVLLACRGLEHDGGGSSVPAGLQAEPALAHQRTLALWLSRIALPATYVVMLGMGALLPTLAVIQGLRPAAATAVGAVWMLARLVTFATLGWTTWWHTRPRLLLGATAVMLGAFLAGILPAALSDRPWTLIPLVIAQIALGWAIGYIYAASLYFGMALSEGSTEHGGYHEALVGVGSVLGPASMVLAGWLRPGRPAVAVVAVAAVIAASLVAAVVAAARAGRRQARTLDQPVPAVSGAVEQR
jgi:hypothetical protein